jgi:hypothetical protein
LAHLVGVSPEELAARFGIDVERPLAQPAVPEPELLAAIEEAVARGVARGLREALAERGKIEGAGTEGDPGSSRRPGTAG